MNKLILVILFIVSFVFATAQTDSTDHEQEVALTSSLQLSLGFNQPIGNYGGRNKPFNQSFAATDYQQINLAIHYGYTFHKNWEMTVGGMFFRNEFDGQRFKRVYLKTVGDGLTMDFLYEHIALHAGAARLYNAGPFLFSAGLAIGGLYTFYANREGNGIELTVTPGNTTNTYKGGTMRACGLWLWPNCA